MTAMVTSSLKATSSTTPDTWVFEPFSAGEIGDYFSDTCPNCKYDTQCPEGCATLMVFSDNKPRGRFALANYAVPFQLTVARAAVNARARGKWH